jgi:hypothetical protein
VLTYGAQLSRAPLSLQSKASRQLQIAMKITLTDGGIETRIIYEFKHSIGDFESIRIAARRVGTPYLAPYFSELWRCSGPLRVADPAERITAALKLWRNKRCRKRD